MNIQEKTGKVCVTSITSSDGWKNAQDISTVLSSIFIILSKPNPDSPYRRDIANLYKDNKNEYEKNVKEYCKKNAIKIPEE